MPSCRRMPVLRTILLTALVLMAPLTVRACPRKRTGEGRQQGGYRPNLWVELTTMGRVSKANGRLWRRERSTQSNGDRNPYMDF
jgi:hypothetical protein